MITKILLIAGILIALGLGLSVVPDYFAGLPESIQILTGKSGILVTALTAILLNILFYYKTLFKRNQKEEELH